MCIYCNKIVNTDLKEINESYIEDIICETDYMGIYRKFTKGKRNIKRICMGIRLESFSSCNICRNMA